MARINRVRYWLLGAGCGLLAAFLVGTGGYYVFQGLGPTKASAAQHSDGDGAEQEQPAVPAVEVVTPQKGLLDRTTTQPGTVEAFESARLFAEVSGYLKKQTVDIGDRVKKGQVLAQIAVPELEKQLLRGKAGVVQAKAQVKQMEARVATAKAQLEEAKQAVVQAEALVRTKAAELRFREIQLQRMKDLVAQSSIDERMRDEKQEQRDAAVEAKNTADCGLCTARAKVLAVAAKIQEAEADVAAAGAAVEVARAEVDKAQVLVDWATITSPYDGVITQRSRFPGDFVRAATEGSAVPLLTVARTDLMRVVVQIPDQDVPYVDPGDPAKVEINTLPGEAFIGEVARLARAEDPQTRLMRVEVDVPNPKGQIVQGMFGNVTITLDRSNLLAVPTSCLVSRSGDNKQGTVYAVRDGHVHLTTVKIDAEKGGYVPILGGLKAGDQVVLHPGGDLQDGQAVTASPVNSAARGGVRR
jgi:RND family efflux transporter MFP subunit